jgi:aspartyl-tRNA(Asn)/glutamyl-tRNA(Gln) amidotransferase subunit C
MNHCAFVVKKDLADSDNLKTALKDAIIVVVEMKITKEEVEHVANLARLELDDTAIEQFADQISNILAYVDKLKQVDTEGIVPTSHAITLTNAFREDKVHDHLDRDESLANAPETEDGTFLVPRVIK